MTKNGLHEILRGVMIHMRKIPSASYSVNKIFIFEQRRRKTSICRGASLKFSGKIRFPANRLTKTERVCWHYSKKRKKTTEKKETFYCFVRQNCKLEK